MAYDDDEISEALYGKTPDRHKDGTNTKDYVILKFTIRKDELEKLKKIHAELLKKFGKINSKRNPKGIPPKFQHTNFIRAAIKLFIWCYEKKDLPPK